LLYAGSLAKKLPQDKHAALSNIIKSNKWISPGSVSAYAVKNGTVQNLIEDGIIDGNYLDNVSGVMAKEFDQLLELEY
jgi:hypothetical protein